MDYKACTCIIIIGAVCFVEVQYALPGVLPPYPDTKITVIGDVSIDYNGRYIL